MNLSTLCICKYYGKIMYHFVSIFTLQNMKRQIELSESTNLRRVLTRLDCAWTGVTHILCLYHLVKKQLTYLSWGYTYRWWRLTMERLLVSYCTITPIWRVAVDSPYKVPGMRRFDAVWHKQGVVSGDLRHREAHVRDVPVIARVLISPIEVEKLT